MLNQPQVVAVYCRVSTDEQAESGSIQNQIEFARRHCDLHGLRIFDVYADDGVSGTVPLAERPEGARLLKDARAGHFSTVLVYRVDRLARRVKHLLDAYEALEGAGVRLSSMTEPIDTQSPIGRFVFQLLGSVAELERETIVERSTLGSNRVAAQGKWLGGAPPYGYYVDDEGYLQISEKPLPGLNMTEADVVRLIYHLLVEERWSCIRIAEHLNALGVPTSALKDGRRVKTSGRWLPNRVRNLVVQTTYKGVHYYGRRSRSNRPCQLIERAVPAIISPEVWEAAENQVLISPQRATRNYLLRGLVKCGICGLNYVGHARGGNRPAQYRCNGRAPYRGRIPGRCPNVGVWAEELENIVWNDIRSFVENPGEVLEKVRARLLEGVETQEAIKRELERIDKAMSQLERERETIVRLLRREVLTYAEGERHLKEVAEQMQALDAERQNLFARLQAAIDFEAKLLNSKVLLDRLRESVAHADDALKRRLIELLVEEVRVDAIGEGRSKQAQVTITYRFGGSVTRADHRAGRPQDRL